MMMGRHSFLLLIALMALAGCGTPNDKAFDADAGKHLSDWVYAKHAAASQEDINSCMECHGSDFAGGMSGVSCSQCHLNGSPLTLTECTSCHGKPPMGTTAPNRNGAHAVHNAFSGVTNVCDTCHTGAGTTTAKHFNGTTDILFLVSYNSSSGTAARNPDGTCSNVSCHGGQTTPEWLTGTINAQCTLCHAFGTAEYNSYSSGAHLFHTTQGYSCVACHSATILAGNHFTTLNTPTLNGFVADTIASGVITTYDPSGNKSCVAICHAANPKNWL
jgi:predicted CxxxxCH...CXXCH cytochrome family protein